MIRYCPDPGWCAFSRPGSFSLLCTYVLGFSLVTSVELPEKLPYLGVLSINPWAESMWLSVISDIFTFVPSFLCIELSYFNAFFLFLLANMGFLRGFFWFYLDWLRSYLLYSLCYWQPSPFQTYFVLFIYFLDIYFYLFIWLLWVLAAACGSFSCGMWDLVLWPRIEPGPPALRVPGKESVSHSVVSDSLWSHGL